MPEADEEMVPEADARAMVRLLAKVACLEGGHEEKKRALMEDLRELVDADYWIWGLAADVKPDEPAVYTSLSTGGFEGVQVAKLFDALNHPDSWEVSKTTAEEVIANWLQVTRLPEDYDPDGYFEDCEGRELWKAANVDIPLVCYRPVSNNCVSAIGLYRKFGRPAFSRRDARIVHIILTEVAWLHEQGWPWESALKVPELPPRCQTTVNLLLEGHSRKEIAEAMQISVHTLNGYVKQIYSEYGVHSQAELMKRFRVGDGGDVPG